MSHTKEPWDAGPNGINIIDPKTGFLIAFTHGNNLKRRGDIRRIVACVNACAGISNADLEMDNSAFINVFNERSEWKARAEFSFRERDKLTKQRDELLAALEKAAEVFDFYAKHHATKTIPEDDKARKNYEHRNMCRTAIASAKELK